MASSSETNSLCKRTKVDQMRQPVGNFSETETFNEILSKAKREQTLILHCHGVPGSGKSEIVVKLAEKFPFIHPAPDVYVKWHIQCDDSGHNVKEELKKLYKHLHKHRIISKEEYNQDILHSIDKNIAGVLVDVLYSSHVPILIIVEDVKAEDRLFIEDFVKSINNRARRKIARFHVYFTTRPSSIVLSEVESSRMRYFMKVNVKGFNMEEGIRFLLNDNSDPDQTAAFQLCERFSGSPLGLKVARACCRKHRISYKKYLLRIEEGKEHMIQEYEKSLIPEEYGSAAKHIFHAITMPFDNAANSDRNALLRKVMSCISFLHHDRIPRFVLEKCCQELREETVENVKDRNEMDSGEIISELIDYGMCTESEDAITFHEVVLHAFRHEQNNADTQVALKNMVYVMAASLTKDLRSKENSRKMYKVIRHVDMLLKHVEMQKTNLIKNEDLQGRLLTKMIISYLYETAGAIASGNPSPFRSSCDHYFEKAVEIIWSKDRLYSLTYPTNGKGSVYKVAENVVDEFAGVEDVIPPNFITEYEAAVLDTFDEKVLNFLESKSDDKIKFQQASRLIHDVRKQNDNVAVIGLLRECNVFLGEEQQQRVFFAERLASILHSWSRVGLFAERNEVKDRYVWFSLLSRVISRICREQHNVPLLSENLSLFSGWIQIILTMQNVKGKLVWAKGFCEAQLKDKSAPPDVYEHGILKQILGSSHPTRQMQMRRLLLQILSRLIELKKTQELEDQGNAICAEMMGLALDQDRKLSNSPAWIVRCALFYAASSNFKQAMHCFRKYFEKTTPESRINDSWAIFNYAKTVIAGKVLDARSQAIAEVKTVLKSSDIMDEQLNAKLCNMLEQLEVMGLYIGMEYRNIGILLGLLVFVLSLLLYEGLMLKRD